MNDEPNISDAMRHFLNVFAASLGIPRLVRWIDRRLSGDLDAEPTP